VTTGRLAAAGLALLASRAAAADLDEFEVKRQHVFTFTKKPTVTRDGDKVTVRSSSRMRRAASFGIFPPLCSG